MERSNFRLRVWNPGAAAAGLSGLKFHELRPTAGTLAAQTGATTKEIMARMGRASSRAAMIYQHVSDERDRRLAQGRAEMIAEEGISPSGLRARLGHDASDEATDRDAQK